MLITKHNIKPILEKYFESKKIQYNIFYSNEYQTYYELFFSSLKCGVHVKYDPNWDDAYVTMFTPNDEQLFKKQWNSRCDNLKELRSELGGMIKSVKKHAVTVSKIEKKIKEIKSICRKNLLNHEIFVNVMWDIKPD